MLSATFFFAHSTSKRPSRASSLPALPPRAALIRVAFQVLLAVGAFLVSWSIECRLDILAVFDRQDVMFDTDPYTRIVRFSDGFHQYDPTFYAHPCLGLVSVPIRLVAKVAGFAEMSVGTPSVSRRTLALLVVPICSALSAVVMFRVFLGAGMGDLASAAGAILHQVSFSQIVFGSVPDHFALGGLGMALVLLAGTGPTTGRTGWIRWGCAGIFATGITITQIIPTCLMFAACCNQRGLRPLETLRHTATLGSLAVVAALSIGAIFNRLDAGQQAESFVDEAALFRQFFARDPWGHAAGVIAAIPNSIAPPAARLVYRRAPSAKRPPSANRSHELQHLPAATRYPFKFTLEAAHGAGRIIAVGMLFLLGTVLGCRARDPIHRALCLGSVAVVTYNLVFHAFYGNEWFLYSEHWLAPLVFVIGGSLRLAETHRLPVLLATVVALTLITFNNWRRIDEVFAVLEAYPPVPVTPSGKPT